MNLLSVVSLRDRGPGDMYLLGQVAYKQGINPLKDWTMATDEAHSTKFTIKGLKEGEKYFVKVMDVIKEPYKTDVLPLPCDERTLNFLHNPGVVVH